MPTKNEILEKKTVKELRQMARNKDLSGYSNMNKPELIDLIGSNYTKSEINSYSGASGGVGGGFSSLPEGLGSNRQVLILTVFVFVAVIGFIAGYFWIAPLTNDSSSTLGGKYVSENYGFSFSYPENWTVEEGRGNSYQIHENIPENQREGSAQISIQDLIQGGTKNIDGVKGIEYSSSSTQYTQSGFITQRIEQIFLPKDNKIYFIGAFSLENEYDGYKSKLNTILDSFTFSKTDFISAKSEDTENYMNDNYGIYFNFPSGWNLQSFPQGESLQISIKEADPGGSIGAQAMVQVADVKSAKSKDVNGSQGVEFTDVRMNQSGETIESRTLFAIKENRLYSLGARAPESVYGDYEPQFDKIFESFTFSE